jgi:hypothetical protein
MARESNSFTLLLRYQAQAERHYRRAIEEFDRLKALREELPNKPITGPDLEPTETAGERRCRLESGRAGARRHAGVSARQEPAGGHGAVVGTDSDLRVSRAGPVGRLVVVADKAGKVPAENRTGALPADRPGSGACGPGPAPDAAPRFLRSPAVNRTNRIVEPGPRYRGNDRHENPRYLSAHYDSVRCERRHLPR